MQVRVSHDDEKMFTVEVTGEDYSLAEIVHHELLNETNVTFAGVVPPHPLLKKLILQSIERQPKIWRIAERTKLQRFVGCCIGRR